jgi:apolipoprotein N-acyltransferase
LCQFAVSPSKKERRKEKKKGKLTTPPIKFKTNTLKTSLFSTFNGNASTISLILGSLSTTPSHPSSNHKKYAILSFPPLVAYVSHFSTPSAMDSVQVSTWVFFHVWWIINGMLEWAI